MRQQIKIFYAADFHGSERVFRKWLRAAVAYRVDALVFGGDIAGKLVVPIVQRGSTYTFNILGQAGEATGTRELMKIQNLLRSTGKYPVVLTEEEKMRYDRDPSLVAGELFPTVVRQTLQNWVELAEEKLAEIDIPAFVMLGNDDYPELSPLLSGDYVRSCEGSVVTLPGDFEMISYGYSNRTPWDSPREMDEVDLKQAMDAMAQSLSDPAHAIFNFHCPPYGTQIDQAPVLDSELRPRFNGAQVATGPVGSTAVRETIEEYQPLLGLHGHIHESPGMHKLGRTIAINPGSDYGDGILRGVIVVLDRTKGVRSWQIVQL